MIDRRSATNTGQCDVVIATKKKMNAGAELERFIAARDCRMRNESSFSPREKAEPSQPRSACPSSRAPCPQSPSVLSPPLPRPEIRIKVSLGNALVIGENVIIAVPDSAVNEINIWVRGGLVRGTNVGG